MGYGKQSKETCTCPKRTKARELRNRLRGGTAAKPAEALNKNMLDADLDIILGPQKDFMNTL